MSEVKRWLAVSAGGDTVRLIPMDGCGPDFFVKANDYDRDLAEMRRQINAMRQDCNTMCNALQRIEAGERDPRMIARRTLEHWSEKAALTSKEPRDDA